MWGNYIKKSSVWVIQLICLEKFNMKYDDQNIFAKIIRGEIPCKKL